MFRVKQLTNLGLPCVGVALALAGWWALSRVVADLPSPRETWLEGKLYVLKPLEKRGEILPWIAEYSPYALVTADDPPVYLSYKDPPALGHDQKDPTHTANFGVKLQEKMKEVGVPCELAYDGVVAADRDLNFGEGLGFAALRDLQGRHAATGHFGIVSGYKCGLVFNRELKKALVVCTSITRTADTTDLAREMIEIVSG